MDNMELFFAILALIILIFGITRLMGRTPRCRPCGKNMVRCDDFGHWKCECGNEKHI